MNNWVFAGRLTKQPEIKKVNDKSLCNFSVALNEGKDKVVFIECDWWGNRGEFLESVSKGTFVVVSGRFNPRKWQTKEGVEKVVFGCTVDNVTVNYSNKATENTNKEVQSKPSVEQTEEPDEDEIPF